MDKFEVLPKDDEQVYILIDSILLKGSVVNTSEETVFVHFRNYEWYDNSFSLSSGVIFPITDNNTYIFNAQQFENLTDVIYSPYSSSESNSYDEYVQSNESEQNMEITQEIMCFSKEIEIDSDRIKKKNWRNSKKWRHFVLCLLYM